MTTMTMNPTSNTRWEPGRDTDGTHHWKRSLGGNKYAIVRRNAEGTWGWRVTAGEKDSDSASGAAIDMRSACLAADQHISGRGPLAPQAPNPIPELISDLRRYVMTWTVDLLQGKTKLTKNQQTQLAEANDLVDRIDAVIEARSWTQG